MNLSVPFVLTKQLALLLAVGLTLGCELYAQESGPLAKRGQTQHRADSCGRYGVWRSSMLQSKVTTQNSGD